VAKKFCAMCGDKEFSALSVLTNIIGEGTILFDVSPNSFTRVLQRLSLAFF